MSGSQAPGHEMPEVTAGHAVVGTEALEALVGDVEVTSGHPDAGVDHDQDVAVLEEAAVDVHGGARGRKAEGVLGQLGQDVDEVGRHFALDHGRVEVVQAQALVVLHFGGRGPGHVHGRHGGAPLPSRPAPGQDEQGLGVAPHAGGQVVQAEELFQRFGVGFFQLDVADVLELPGDQVLGPPAQVDERLGEVAAQYDLAGAELDRRSLYGIEGAGHFGNLVLSRDRDGQAFGDGARVAVEHGVKSGGQVRAGQLLGLVGQPRQRPGDGAADQGQEDEPQEGARQAGQAELARLTNGVVVQLRGPLVDDGRDLGVPLLGNGVVARGLARPGAALPEGLQQGGHRRGRALLRHRHVDAERLAQGAGGQGIHRHAESTRGQAVEPSDPGLLGAQVLGGLVDGGGSGGRCAPRRPEEVHGHLPVGLGFGEAGDEGLHACAQRGVCYLVGDLGRGRDQCPDERGVLLVELVGDRAVVSRGVGAGGGPLRSGLVQQGQVDEDVLVGGLGLTALPVDTGLEGA